MDEAYDLRVAGRSETSGGGSVRRALFWGGWATIACALAFAVGGVLVAVDSAGGLGGPEAGIAYYVGLVLSAPAMAALYGSQVETSGKAGLVGFGLAATGAVLYGTGAFLVLPIAEQIPAAHDLWIYAMARAPVIPIGGGFFLIGSAVLGWVSARSGRFPKWAAWAFFAGSILWLVAFYGGPGIAFLLPVGNWVGGVGLAAIGWKLARS
jgi:hypothetical protein